MKKGFFPHKLSNIVEDGFESVEWPDIIFFEPWKLQIHEREELVRFLEQQQGSKFIFMDECIKYCEQDVLILALATLAMEKATLVETGFQISFIYSSAFTVASLSSVYYRHLSIGLFPVHGYANLTNVQSLSADLYFRFLNHKRRQQDQEPIRYSKSSIYGEYKLGSLKVCSCD